MTMTGGLRWLLAVTVLVLAAHFLLGHFLAQSDFMASLAAARHGHYGSSLAFALLLGVRLIAIVLVPPLWVAGVGLLIYERVARRRG